MPAQDKHARTAAKLMVDTGSASASVVSARLLAFSNPFDFMSRQQQREVSRMVSETLKAGLDGWMAASVELAAMPWRLLQATARPPAFTPAVAMETWMALGGLWIGVGNAALQPARDAVMANRARLRRGP
jgi:hypothetical protein